MDVILLERIEKLGHLGEIVKVKPGFARNYLLPQKKALRATKDNLAYFEAQRSRIESDNQTRREKATALAAVMDNLSINVIRSAGDTGILYGSVSARDIAEELIARDHAIERRMVQLDQPIKSLGLFPTKIRLHPEVSIDIMVNVARSEDEATLQLQRGGMVSTEDLAREAEEAELAAEAEAELDEAEGAAGDETSI